MTDKRKKIPAVILLVVISGIAFAIATNYLNQQDRIDVIKEEVSGELTDDAFEDPYEEDINLIRYNGRWYRQNPDLEITLIIGVDVKTYDQKPVKQGDFLMLVAMDKENNRYQALHINRDTMTDIPQLDMFEEEYGTLNRQVALAYAQGKNESANCRNTVKAVSNLLYGLDIDHYASITMDAVPVINDLVGGVPVFVEDDFSGIDPNIKQGETITLQGSQALTFVRTRKGMEEPTNMARMERQRTYMHSLANKTAEKVNSNKDFVINSLLELASYLTSDCTINKMAEMLNTVLASEQTDILTIEGEAIQVGEYMEYRVDEEALQNQIIELFYVEDTSR